MACGMICLHGVSKSYGAVRAVQEAQLCVERGEFVAFLGPSGCGKTMLLRLIAGFEEPDAGEIRLHDATVAAAGHWTPPERRREACDQAQQRRLAATGRTEEGDELATLDAKLGLVDGTDRAVALRDPVEADHPTRHVRRTLHRLGQTA